MKKAALFLIVILLFGLLAQLVLLQLDKSRVVMTSSHLIQIYSAIQVYADKTGQIPASIDHLAIDANLKPHFKLVPVNAIGDFDDSSPMVYPRLMEMPKRFPWGSAEVKVLYSDGRLVVH